MKNNIETTDIHSEEVEDVLSIIPDKIIRWGATTISLIIILILCTTAFIEYPDVINSEITITAVNPPVQIKGRVDGKIENLFVADKDSIKSEQYIACVSNAANFNDVMKLKQWLDTVDVAGVVKLPLKFDLLLGELQTSYIELQSLIKELQNQNNIEFYDKKIASFEAQLLHYNNYLSNVKKQSGFAHNELAAFYKQYKRDSLLLLNDVISESEFDNSNATYYQKKTTTQNSDVLVSQTQLKISECEQALLDLQLIKAQENHEYISKISDKINGLKTEFLEWELKYVIKSPSDGIVSFSKDLMKNYSINANDVLCTIIPNQEIGYLGKAMIPVAGSGKVCKGDKVIIKPDNYPYLDFGIVYGEVVSISLLPQNNHYLVEIRLPDGLTTSYGKELNTTGEVQGKAELITENHSLLNRLIKPIYAALKE
ncbi:MAG TPA: hypothetical protein DDX39_12815 [Bacteroidales bacterium]|nr:MAG: hypothetical protein A2W98_02555 [Bacteroidetes bacterium GWF2_33_38]OFY74125.1 MAG: hypothetical protein A2265_05405 [Bacteroidetes bacterium RIFOXYA12_FULL_33_9]OFY89003.1 MAG: hypothetical protein A2236_05500 [Bacteroidetes bacterium RIFOXYA2_FULL_33_7]HBF89514.1 hypothetical protein [Bacteroidales bacterium]